MPKIILKSRAQCVLAYVEIDNHGRHTIRDNKHRLLGRYDPKTNKTTDAHSRLVGYGYLLPALLTSPLDEDGTRIRRPKPPLTTDQQNRRASRQSAMQQSIRDEQSRSAEKLKDLRAKAAGL